MSLLDMSSLGNSEFETGKQQVNGKEYPDTLYVDQCIGGNTYELNREYDTFEAKVGLSQGATPEDEIEYFVVVDGKTKANGTLIAGEIKEVKVNLSGAARIELGDPDKLYQSCESSLVWIDPTIS